jgi:hypothetical protein
MSAWWLLSLTGVVFQLAIFHAMARGAWRAYLPVFVYVLLMFWGSVLYAGASVGDRVSFSLSRYYWVIDNVLQAFVFVVVLALVRQSAGPRRGLVTRWLIALALATGVLSLVASSGLNFNSRMTFISRNLGFCAAITNLILWASLIRSRHPDRTLLLLSGGLGVEMAGKAIGHSLRTLAPGLVDFGNLVIVLSYLFGLYVWWQAFRHWRPNPAAAAGVE